MIDQKQVVEALLKPKAYENNPQGIELVQTHISFVFLTREFVYKVKKAVNLGFLDFTSLEKRRFFCERELELNRRLCGGMYLEVVPINESDDIRIKGEGETIEYAVKMKRMPQDRMLSKLLEQRKVDANLIDEIAKIMSKFHSEAETKNRIGNYELDPIVEINWKENFEQTVEFIGSTISKGMYEQINKKIEDFVKRNLLVFKKRMKEGKVRNCHGDVHSGNIFVTDTVYIFDAIEFNERISYSDVAGDVGFLAMDLDFKERTDLSNSFVERYIRYSGDRELEVLLPFYKCYRAYVRGKVVSFRLKDPNISDVDKKEVKKEAEAYFRLAFGYTKGL